MTHLWTLWTRNLLGTSLGLSSLLATSLALGQVPAVPAAPAVDPAPVVEDATDAAKDAKDASKDAVKDAKDTAKTTTPPVPGTVRGTVRDAREEVRDTARDARDTARDTAKDARSTVQGAREGVRDTARDTRETARDARDGARDTVRDARGVARDTVRDARGSLNGSGSARANLRWQDLQSADLGLWFNRNAKDGLIVSDVGTQGPIAKLGFQEGDRIVSVGGQTVATQPNFMQQLFSSNVAGGRVPVILNRGGTQQTIYMEPNNFLTHVNTYQHDPLEQIGIVSDDRVQNKAVVWKVLPRSPAYFAGVRNGDVITNFNNQPVASAADLSQLAAKAEPGAIPVEVQRGDKARQLEVDFQNPNTEVHSALRPNLDSAADPSLNSSVAPRTGGYNSGYSNSGYNNNGYNSGRRGIFRGRR